MTSCPKGVSVVICCYNSNSRLPKTLEHLASQICPAVAWEVIIVDNASTDNTREIAKKLCLEYFSKLNNYKIIEELNPGLSNARQRGLIESQYEYLLFCDDDNWLHQDFISRAYEIMESNPKIGVLGGRSEAVSDIALPVWFSTYQNNYAVGVQAISSGNISTRGYVWGAGMLLRKFVLEKLISSGFKSLLSDRSGKLLSSGGDSEICKWFLIAGYDLWYDERLVFKHFVPASRLTKIYVEELNSGIKKAEFVLSQYDYFIDNVLNRHQSSMKNFYGTVYHSLKYLITRHRFSLLFLASSYPPKITRLIDPKYYNIRISTKNYLKSN